MSVVVNHLRSYQPAVAICDKRGINMNHLNRNDVRRLHILPYGGL